MTAAELVQRFEGVRQHGDRYEARCPVHDDQRQSLSVGRGEDGRILLHCFAGCAAEDIVGKVGLSMHDLMNGSGNGHAGAPLTITDTYDYQDANDRTLFEVCRLAPKSFRARRPNGAGGWIWNLTGITRVLYRLPELLKADPAAPVWVVEGEKDVDRLWAIGMGATCNPGGAGKWRSEFNEHLRGRHVVIIPDNDPPGIKHAEDIARSLQGVAATVKVVNLPGVPPKGDASDWLNAGHAVDELRALADAAPTWTDAAPVTAAGLEVPAFPQTDAGSGELIAHLHGDRLRYDHRRGRWLLWSGHYWTADCAAAIRNMAIEAARWRYQRASSIADLKSREAEAKFAIKSESRDKVEAALYFAEAMSPIADHGDDWDRQPHLIGCPNGIVDLKTGTLRPGRPEDRITMTTGIEFDPDARAPRWDRFLVEIFSEATDLIDWIHRAIGHSATGDTSEQIVCILHGDGCNGKSVFCTTLRHVLGDYAHTMPFSTVEDGTRRSIPNDVAALVNRRFVFASETKENRRLNEARIKELTGGDAIPARFLNHEWFTFQPVLKPWLAVNHLPLVEDLSFGFWRRVRLIPFVRQFKGDQADKHLADTLKAEAPGILAWIVRGAVAWYERGLDPVPDAVKAATDNYERASDELGEYVAERLFVHDNCTTRAGDLFKNYTAWAEDRGMKTSDRLTATAFGRSMGKRFRKTSDRHGTIYHGIGLPAPDEEGPTHD